MPAAKRSRLRICVSDEIFKLLTYLRQLVGVVVVPLKITLEMSKEALSLHVFAKDAEAVTKAK